MIIICKRWFQKSYGNTYHSVKAIKDGVVVAHVPFAYGYGNHCLATAAQALGMTSSELLTHEVTIRDVNRKKDL